MSEGHDSASIWVDKDVVECGDTIRITVYTGPDGIRQADSQPFKVYRKENGEWGPAPGNGALMMISEREAGITEHHEYKIRSDPGEHRAVLNAMNVDDSVDFEVIASGE